MKKAFFIIMMMALAALFMMPASSFAVQTTSGVIITAEGTSQLMFYTDLGGTVTTEIFGTTREVTVTAMYGLTFPISAPADQNTTPGVTVYYGYSVTNKGNTSDLFKFTSSESYSGSETAWNIVFYEDGNNNGTRDAGENTVITQKTVSENATYYFVVGVTPRLIAVPNSTDTVTTKATSETSGPVGIYTGANGTSYGGVGYGSDATITTIKAGSIGMTRTASVDAPNTYVGGKHDPVPGAAITYKITYEAGAATGVNSVIIVDKVPTNTTALHMDAYVNRQGAVANVTISLAGPTTEGWKPYYSTQGSPSFDFGVHSSIWLPADTVNLTLDGTSVTYIKWEKNSVAASEKGTLTWGVTIK